MRLRIKNLDFYKGEQEDKNLDFYNLQPAIKNLDFCRNTTCKKFFQ